MSKKTYELKVGCHNCFHKWTQNIPFGEDVDEGAIVTYLRCKSEAIECPNCGSRKTFKISP